MRICSNVNAVMCDVKVAWQMMQFCHQLQAQAYLAAGKLQ